MDIGSALDDPRMFQPFFRGRSWSGWKAVLRATFALKMTKAERAFFHSVAGRDPPERQVREAVFVVGRRGGKDSVASAVAANIAASFKPRGRLRPGERAAVLCLAVDRNQADTVLDYTRAYFQQIPALAALIETEQADGFRLKNGVDVEIATSDYRRVRGRTVLCAIFDEVAYWRSDNSASPDREVYRAIRPGLTTLAPESILIMITTAYKRSGVAFDAWAKHYGKDDPRVLVIRAGTAVFNPGFDQAEIDDAIVQDAEAARADYLSEWRDDLANYLSRDAIEACVDRGVKVRPWRQGVHYVSWFDASGGKRDSFTVAVAHSEGDLVILDATLEVKAPYEATTAVAQAAALLRAYHLHETMGDDYGAGFVISAFKQQQIRVLDRPTGVDRSVLYLEILPRLTSRAVRLLDDERAVLQFSELERRVMPAGRDKIDHPNRTGHHDDLANAIAGALWRASAEKPSIGSLITPELLARARQPAPPRSQYPMPSGKIRCFF